MITYEGVKEIVIAQNFIWTAMKMFDVIIILIHSYQKTIDWAIAKKNNFPPLYMYLYLLITPIKKVCFIVPIPSINNNQNTCLFIWPKLYFSNEFCGFEKKYAFVCFFICFACAKTKYILNKNIQLNLVWLHIDMYELSMYYVLKCTRSFEMTHGIRIFKLKLYSLRKRLLLMW